MEAFFDQSKLWPGGGSYPHVLVLLDRCPEWREYVRAHGPLVARYPHLSLVPDRWLHLTVQGVHHAVDARQWERMVAGLRRELAGVPPLEVTLGPVWPGVTAITAAVYPEEEITVLHQRARAAVAGVPGVRVRPESGRWWPHTTLAYATAPSTPGEDRVLNRSLRGVRPPRVTLTVDRVHLVRQWQHPDAGYYTWDQAVEIPLAGRPDVGCRP